jgi:hypothetical protein
MTGRAKCPRCGHAGHDKACRAKGPSRCVTVSDGTATATMCGIRPPCPCAWRTCACGTPVALAAELPPEVLTLPLQGGDVMIVSAERGSAGAPGGLLAVRVLADGFLACRDLAAGEQPAKGEWRGREHAGDCGQLAQSEADPRWLTLSC